MNRKNFSEYLNFFIFYNIYMQLYIKKHKIYLKFKILLKVNKNTLSNIILINIIILDIWKNSS